MKNTLKRSLFAVAIAASLSLSGCANPPSAEQVHHDISAVTPDVTKLVDLGLAVSGNGALVPLNDAGSAIIQNAQKALDEQHKAEAKTLTEPSATQ